MSSLEDIIFGSFDVNSKVKLNFDEMLDGEDEFLSQALNNIEEEPAQAAKTEVLLEDGRFPTMTEDEIDDLVSSKDSKSTTKMTRWAVRQFKRNYRRKINSIAYNFYDKKHNLCVLLESWPIKLNPPHGPQTSIIKIAKDTV